MRKAVCVFLLLVSLVFSSTVFAQARVESTRGGEVGEHLRELREKRLKIGERIDEKRGKLDEKRDKLDKKRQEVGERVATKQAEGRLKAIEKIKGSFAKILQRFDAAMVRLDRLAERIASRIDKLKGRGVDTKVAEAKLVEAEKAGATVARAIADAKAAVSAIDVESATVREAVDAAKEAVSGVKKALFDYHKALVAAIVELKASAELREGTGESE